MPRETSSHWNSTQPYFTQPDAHIPVLELAAPSDFGAGAIDRMKRIAARCAMACRRGWRPVRWATNYRS
ncbi:MAG: hypothetical protein QNJ94_15490 [Alphaproteobacteria bacterium]|nr:hypothetical protein [Alphaproteobacteria bacterium]